MRTRNGMETAFSCSPDLTGRRVHCSQDNIPFIQLLQFSQPFFLRFGVGFFLVWGFWGVICLIFPAEEGWLSLSYTKMNGRLVATDIEIAMNYSSKGLPEFSCSEKGTSPAAREEGGTLPGALPAQTGQPHQPPPQRGGSRGRASHQPQQRLWGDTAGDGQWLQAGHGGYAPDAF